VAIFSFKRGKIDKWYKTELKTLNDTYYNFKNANGSSSSSGIQESIIKSNQLETATNALKKEYRNKLKEIGVKPRSDFMDSKDGD